MLHSQWTSSVLMSSRVIVSVGAVMLYSVIIIIIFNIYRLLMHVLDMDIVQFQ